MSAAVAALRALEAAGYVLLADGERIRLLWIGAGEPSADLVRPLLDELRTHKADALAYLHAVEAAGVQKNDSRKATATLQHCNTPPEIGSLPDRDDPAEPLQSTVAVGVAVPGPAPVLAAEPPAAVATELAGGAVAARDTATVTATPDCNTSDGPLPDRNEVENGQPLQCCSVAAGSTHHTNNTPAATPGALPIRCAEAGCDRPAAAEWRSTVLGNRWLCFYHHPMGTAAKRAPSGVA